MNKKAAFQKVIGDIRKDWRVMRGTPQGEYPKAMMTGQQAEHNTATVNCGGEHCSFSNELAEFVMNDARFREFLLRTGAGAVKEKFWHGSCPGYQIRINFKEG